LAVQKATNSLDHLLTREILLKIAGDRYFERGDDDARRGCVRDLSVAGDRAIARVSGTEEYEVELWGEAGKLQSSGTCPLDENDIFTNIAWQ
jgi:uncharacterized Zn finger protein